MSEVGRGRVECFEHCANSSRVQSTRELVVRYNQLKLQISIKTLPSSIIPHVNMFGVSDIPKTIASDIPKTIVSDIPKTTLLFFSKGSEEWDV